MKKILSLLLMSALLSGCASIQVPAEAVARKGGKSEVFTGVIKASLTEGVFELTSKKGTTCHGTYDQFSMEVTLLAYVTCSDGRHGKIVSTRDMPMTKESGHGTGTLNDGTKFNFTFGPNINDKAREE